jgi:preprotein translocase subunit SecD
MITADLNGAVVWAPVIEPTQQSFTSLHGVLAISDGLSKSEAQAVAAALRSGPLAIPLSVTRSAP